MTPSAEAQKLADEFIIALDHETLADPSCALADLIQGVKDGADSRTEELENHRRKWRGHSMRLHDAMTTAKGLLEGNRCAAALAVVEQALIWETPHKRSERGDSNE